MQIVLRINKKKSIRMNNWVIFFHFKMIGIEFALSFTKMWFMKHSKYTHRQKLSNTTFFQR